MKRYLRTIMALAIVLAFLLVGCTLDDPNSPKSLKTPTGAQIFKNYVAIGNSLTAGFMDSGLLINGQMNSFPLLIAQAIGLKSDDFTQPYVAFPGIGSTDTGNPLLIAGVLHFDGSSVVPVGTTDAAAVQGLLLAAAQPAPYHNLGVPGALSADILNAYDAASSAGGVPFFDFINRASLYGNTQEDVVVLETDGVTPKPITYETASTGWQAITKGPTLATVWIGNNGILGGATGGNPSGANMVNPVDFGANFSDLMQVLAGGLVERTGFPATIVVANIPGITDTAYFLTPTTFEAAAGGAWPWGTDDADVALYTFPVLSWIADPANQGTAIPSNYTLTGTEQGLVDGYVTNYNAAITATVAAINASGMATVGLIDVNQVLNDLPAAQKTHFMLLLPQMGNDVAMAAAATRFSLDGVHPNNKGYGVVANAFIDVINTLAGTEVAAIDVDALAWDPTYGQPLTKTADRPRLSPEAATQMAAIWQH